jgi:hypothetical protein
MVMLLTPPTKAVGGPSETPSKKNSTVPVAELGVTVAVKVIFSLSQEGLLLEVTVVVVAVCAIPCRCEREHTINTIKAIHLLSVMAAVNAVRFIWCFGWLLMGAAKPDSPCLLKKNACWW